MTFACPAQAVKVPPLNGSATSSNLEWS